MFGELVSRLLHHVSSLYVCQHGHPNNVSSSNSGAEKQQERNLHLLNPLRNTCPVLISCKTNKGKQGKTAYIHKRMQTKKLAVAKAPSSI